MIQQLLFNQPSLNIVKPLKQAMGEAIAASGKSREKVVDDMNLLADRYGVCLVKGRGRLGMAQIEKWLNTNDPARIINLKALAVFCAVTESIEPLQVLARPLGFVVVGEKEKKMLAWARAHFNEKEARQIKKRLEEAL